jgi:hypothetical protein
MSLSNYRKEINKKPSTECRGVKRGVLLTTSYGSAANI